MLMPIGTVTRAGADDPVQLYPVETPRYRALAREVEQVWAQVSDLYETMRAEWFAALDLTDPQRASQAKDFSRRQRAQVDAAIEEFLAGFAGDLRDRQSFVSSATADGGIQQLEMLAYSTGVSRAAALTEAAAPVVSPLSALVRQRLLTEAFERLTEDGRFRFENRLGEIRQAMLDGYAAGENPLLIAKRLSTNLDGYAAGRLRTIVRTEMGLASEAGIRDELRGEGVRKLEVIGDPNTDALCTVHIGQQYSVDDTENLPIFHPNCAPGYIVVEGPHVLASTARWWIGELVELQTRNGYRLAVTPNHPVLTPEGWIGAGLLHEGSYVISGRWSKREGARNYPHDYQVPARIEDIAQSIGEARAVTPARMPCTAEHFHGDGGGSEVYVVRTDRLLRDGLDTSFGEPHCEQEFSGRRPEAAGLARCGSCALLGHRMLAPPNRLMGSGYQALPFLGSTALAEHAQGFRQASRRDPVVRKNAQDLLALDFPIPSAAALSVSGEVGLDKILGISRREFSGHVYNLQTVGGWFLANGIVTHNCFCSTVPVLED